MICEECKSCPIETLCDTADSIIDENFSLDGEHDILMAIYEKGRADAEAEQKAICDSCIHKVSADDLKQISNDTIDECIAKITNEHTHSVYNDVVYEAILLLEQLKK